MENCKSVATALNIAALNLTGLSRNIRGKKVAVDYFLEGDRVMLTLSDSENESYDEEIPDLGKNILIEPDIVDSSDDSDGEEMATNSFVVMEEVDRVLKSVEYLMEAEYDCNCEGSQ
jgi:hypothetical protein